MRIVFVGSASAGGAERVTVSLCNGFAERMDYDVFLITGKKDENEYEICQAVKRFEMLEGKLLYDVGKLKNFINENKIDIAVGMGIYNNFLVCMSKARSEHCRMIISERNDPKHDLISWKSRLLRFVVYRRADGYVFQTERAKALYSGKIQRRGVVIPNPLQENLPYKSDTCKKEIVAVGRLEKQKNYEMLLRAFEKIHRRHPEYILRIFGKGSKEQELRSLADKLGIAGNVRFEGFIRDPHALFVDADIFVMTSDFEGMPNALMEAMAMGFPVVSTDCPCGGPKCLIKDGGNGCLVPVNGTDALSEKVCSLIEVPQMKKKIAVNALKVREDYSIGMILNKWDAFFKSG